MSNTVILGMLVKDSNGMKKGPQVLVKSLRKWLYSPQDVFALQASLSDCYDSYLSYISRGSLNGIYNAMDTYFKKKGQWARWQTSTADIRECKGHDMSASQTNNIKGLCANDTLYIVQKLRGTGIEMYTKAKKNNNCYAIQKIYNFIQCHDMVKTLQKCLASRNQDKFTNLKVACDYLEAAASRGEVYTPYGYTESQLVNEILPNWSKEHYVLSASEVAAIKSGSNITAIMDKREQ